MVADVRRRSASAWFRLSDEVKLKILGYLDVRSLLKASGACRDWRRVAADNTLWRAILSYPASLEERAVRQRVIGPVPRTAWLSVPHVPGDTLKSRYGRLEEAVANAARATSLQDPTEVVLPPACRVVGMQTLGSSLFALMDDGYFRAYDVETCQFLAISSQAHSSLPLLLVREDADGLAVSHTTRCVVSIDAQQVLAWALPSMTLLARLPHPACVGGVVRQDGRFVVTFTQHDARVWRLAAAEDAALSQQQQQGTEMRRRRGSCDVSSSNGSRRGSVHRRSRRTGSDESSRQRGNRRDQSRSSIGGGNNENRRRSDSRRRASRASQEQRVKRRRTSNNAESNAKVVLAFLSSSLDDELGRRRALASGRERVGSTVDASITCAGFIRARDHVVVATHIRAITWDLGTGEQAYSVVLPAAAESVHQLRLRESVPMVRVMMSTDLMMFEDLLGLEDISLINGSSFGDIEVDFGAVLRRSNQWFYSDGDAVWICDLGPVLHHVVPSFQQSKLLPVTQVLDDVSGGVIASGAVDPRHWENTRPFPLARSWCIVPGPTGTIDVSKPGARAPLMLSHEAEADQAFLPVQLQLQRGVIAVALPYLFTASETSPLIKRWDFRRIGTAKGVEKPSVRDERPFQRHRRFMACAALLSSLAYVLWLLRLDAVLSQSYLILLTPLWLADVVLVVVFMRSASDNVNLASDFQSEFSRHILVGVIFAWILACPLLAALRADGLAAFPWLAITLPLWLPCLLAAISVVALVVRETQARALAVPYSLGTLSQGLFLVFFSHSYDVAASAAPIARLDTFWFHWCGHGVFTLFFALAVLSLFRRVILGFLYAKLLRRPIPDWVSMLGNSWYRPFDLVYSEHLARVSMLHLFSPQILLASQVAWYLRLRFNLSIPYALILLPFHGIPIALAVMASAYLWRQVRQR